MQLSKNVTKCLLFIIIHISSTHFPINLFYLHSLKQTMEQTIKQQPHLVRERTKSKQKQKNSRHIKIDHPFYCSIKSRNNANNAKPISNNCFNDISVNANPISVRLKSKRQLINIYLRDISTVSLSLVGVVFKHMDHIQRPLIYKC